MTRDDIDREMPELRFLVFLEGDTLVASGLESEIGAQAKDFDTLILHLGAAIDAESKTAADTEDVFPPIKTGQARAIAQAIWDDEGCIGVTRVAVSNLFDTYRIVRPSINDVVGIYEPARSIVHVPV